MGLSELFKTRKISVADSGIMRGRTDRHSHILYGVDDGISSLEESLAVLDYQESIGVRSVWCTPHIMEDVPNQTSHLKARFEELCEAYEGPLELHLAAEYMIDTLFEERFRQGDLLTMENSTILVETSTWTPPVNLFEVLRQLQNAGYRPLFAHPERYRYLKIPDYERLRQLGISFQLNLPSLIGFYGESTMGRAQWLLEHGYYTGIGSDCHRLKVLKEQYSREGLKKQTLQLLSSIDNPQ